MKANATTAALLQALADVTPDATRSFAPLPKGEYTVKVERAQWKTSQSGGHMLSVGFTEANSKRWLWANLNVVNASEAAARIGMQQFAQLLAAFDTTAPDVVNDPGLLVGRSATAYVSIDKQNENRISNLAALAPAVIDDVPF